MDTQDPRPRLSHDQPTAGLASLSLPTQIPSLSDTYGALFIGMCLSILLYGVTVHQVYRYFRLYPKDRIAMKATTLHTIMPIHICYYHLVTNYFNPGALLTDTCVCSVKQVVAMTLCQGFYVRRVYIFGPELRSLVALAIVLLLAEFALTVQAFEGHQWLVAVIYGLAVAIDAIVTGVLIVVLLKSQVASISCILALMNFYSSSTDSLIQTLALTKSGNMVYVAMGAVATKLYANSVLAVLNSRRSLAERAMNGFTANTLQLEGNLQPATSTVIFGRNNSQRVTVSLPPLTENPEHSATRATSESEDTVREITGDNKV
ncbi:hypothetical protein PYCCODRAFT_1447422 [Trametes coccinea BRFM310]|uniref:DUF6534 domain-containing protein n=1 Tax=Trametes coccinea (strain BRFM310) TaxID=1353009 RepID=A0A1Y2IBR1_TRAC3|nr:hypothetical protein PYCCODRAFT_1447422 [Trametes coccinea BRFM310]